MNKRFSEEQVIGFLGEADLGWGIHRAKTILSIDKAINKVSRFLTTYSYVYDAGHSVFFILENPRLPNYTDWMKH